MNVMTWLVPVGFIWIIIGIITGIMYNKQQLEEGENITVNDLLFTVFIIIPFGVVILVAGTCSWLAEHTGNIVVIRSKGEVKGEDNGYPA